MEQALLTYHGLSTCLQSVVRLSMLLYELLPVLFFVSVLLADTDVLNSVLEGPYYVYRSIGL